MDSDFPPATRRSLRLRPCIDLKDGRVVQIVGGTLRDSSPDSATTNFSTPRRPGVFSRLFRRARLPGGHVIALGPGNETAAVDALSSWPGGLHYGGGVTDETAAKFLDAGASHVIVTSFVFDGLALSAPRLESLARAVGKSRLVLDLSCRKTPDGYRIATNRWQTLTDVAIDAPTLSRLSAHCDEFLVHAADVEGKRAGIDSELVALLAEHSPIPTTYAGGVGSWADIDRFEASSGGRIDLTIGSALDIFGGTLPFADVVARFENP